MTCVSTRSFIRRLILAALLVGVPVAPAQAASRFWRTTVSLGDWLIATNWTNDIGPTSIDAAIFGIPMDGGALITAPGAQALDVFLGVVTTNSNGTLRGSRGTLTLSAPGGGGTPGGGTPGTLVIGNRLVIGQSDATAVGVGTLNISSGGDLNSNSVEVAITADGPFGTINVADPGSNLNTGRLTLGNNTGHGVLNVQNGAIVSCQNEGLIAGTPFLPGSSAATGAATVTGAGSLWFVNSGFVVGYNANGSLTVSNGGTINSLEASIATLPGSVGTVTVTGANSRWIAIPFSNIFVGGWSGSTASGGAGSISIFDGGQVITSLLKVFSTGFVRVDNGSTSVPGLIARGTPPAHTMGGSLGDVLVGQTGSGRMEIRDGGAVRTLRGHIGFNSGADGAVLVNGSGAASSLWQCTGSIWVGNGGNGTLEVRDGADVISSGQGYIAFNANTSGYALVSGAGSLWQTAVQLWIGGNGAGPGGFGTLQIENSGVVQAPAATLYNTGTLALGADPILNAPLTVLGGSIQAMSNTTFTNSFTLGAGGVHVFTNFSDATFSGIISGAGALDKSGGFTSGPGTLSLTGSNTYTGGTAVSAGRLLANNTSGSATGSGPVTVSPVGETVLGGSGTIGGPVTVSSGATLLGGRGVAPSGALTIANDITLNPGAKIQLVLGGSGAHSTLSRTAGTWSFPANLAFRFLGSSAQPGFHDNIITGLADDPGNVGTWTIETAGFSGSFSYDGEGNIDLDLTEAPPATSCDWSSAPPYPIPVLDYGAATVGTAIYSFGGVSNFALTANSYKFDGTNWSPIAPLPEGLESPAIVSDGTFVYIMGGYNGATVRNTLYRYDPASDTYTTLAPSNVATWSSGGAFLNGKLYKIAGYSSTTAASNAVEVYNIASNSWSAAASYPVPVGFLSAFARNGFVYAAGGMDFSSFASTAKTFRYDPSANTWSDGAIADLPATRWGAATLLDSGGPVLAGGYAAGNNAGAISASAIRWDPATNTWSSLPDMSLPRARTSGAVLSGSLSVIGGRSPEGDSFTGTTDHQVQACPPFTFTVNTVDDHNDGVCNVADCTLREAITGANTRFGFDIIAFAPGVTGVIQLTSALPDLSSDIMLQGPGADLLTVRRNTGANYRIFSVGVGTSVTLSGLTIADGRATGAFPANCGGGIYADHSVLNLVNLTLRGNTATLHGGSIFNAQSTIALSGCTLETNSASASGGAIFNFGIGGVATLSLTNCTVHQNAASQYGGAIYNDGTGGGNASLTLTNCTFNQNTASLIAGGIYNDGLNPGSSGTTTLHLGNTILNAGASGANLVNDGATVISDGHNLSSDDAGGFLSGTGDVADTDPQLDPTGLTNNGGPTQTIALLAGSPAVNTGDDGLAPSLDQRGYSRSGLSDIGAFEFNGAAVPISLLGIVSRKEHGGSGSFEIDLLVGSPAVEGRSGGAGNNHTIVFRFASELVSVGGVGFSGVGAVSSAAIGSDPLEYVVELTGVTNAQVVGVTLTNVNDAAGGHSDKLGVSMGVLLGDTTGNGSVSASDIGQTKAQSGAAVTASNFRTDVNVNGSVNATDIGQVKAQSGTQLPP